MTILWLGFWIASHTPDVFMWNNWAIGLTICIGLDLADRLLRK